MKAIFPGSFDPVTLGHVEIIRRGAAMAGELLVAVLVNPDKQGLFTPQKRVELLKDACGDLPGVSFMIYNGLLADLARETGVRLVIRGVRTSADLDAESAMARANARLLPGLETALLPASPQASDISSSLVRQIAFLGGDVSPFLPPGAARALNEMYRQKKASK